MTTLSSFSRCLLGFILASFAIGLLGAALATASERVEELPKERVLDGFPSKLQVLRAGIKDGKLDVYAETSTRTNGDAVEVDYEANGRHTKFSQTIKDGSLRIDHKLPASQSRYSTGIVTLTYRGGMYGNDRVLATQVRMRAASGKARLDYDHLRLDNNIWVETSPGFGSNYSRLQAEGTVANGARGVIRFEMTYDHPKSAYVSGWEGEVVITNGRWKLDRIINPVHGTPAYLTIQYTGYLPGRIRGEQVAKQLIPGETYR